MGKLGPIAFFDSGIGGLPYLEWVRQHMPEHSYTYLADRKNFPYGQKPLNLLTEMILGSMERYIDQCQPRLMVVACNTASVTALEQMRQRFSIPFVGVVPAIKPAAQQSENGSIGLLATKRTVEDPYTDNLVRLFAEGRSVERFAGVDMVDFVENRLLDASESDLVKIIQPVVDHFRTKKIDSLVLGCTHFLHIRDRIARAFGERVRIVDSVEGVGRQVLRLAADNGASENGSGSIFYISGSMEDEGMYRRFADRYRLAWGGSL